MRFTWHVELRTERRDGDASRSPFLLRWAIVGLAVLGVAAVILVRHYGG